MIIIGKIRTYQPHSHQDVSPAPEVGPDSRIAIGTCHSTLG